ncbi:MAG: autotransporter outer membrane beta-barrel domain-containing protein, partial [Candidatus Accumulibacter sp.]|nr:autotransporter outer membrane beta-barrel domain-containing protein [Accumulibacter sp.]
INPTSADNITLRGGGVVANTVSGNLYADAWTNKDVAGYFAPLGTFQSLVADAVADAINNTNFGGAVVTMSGSARTTAAINDTRIDVGVSYDGVHFMGFDSHASNFGGGVAGAYNPSTSVSVGDITNSVFSNNTVDTAASSVTGGGVVGASSAYNNASVGNISNSVFSGNTFLTTSFLIGGGVVGARGNSYSAHVGSIENSVFSDNMITTRYLQGGGVVGGQTDGGGATIDASIGAITNSVFSGNTVVTTGAALQGGGVAGTYATGTSFVGPISNSVFSGNMVEAYSIYGGGVVGAYNYNATPASVGYIENSIFSGNTVSTNSTIYGGGVAGAHNSSGSAAVSVGYILNSVFSDNNVTTSYLFGGGVVGAYSGSSSRDASVSNIENSVFSDNTIMVTTYLQGGGMAGAWSSSSTVSVGDIVNSVFSDNKIMVTTYLQGGGVAGAFTYNDTATASVGNISKSLFTRNTITATSSYIYGGLIYTADDLTIADSAFTDNAFTYGTTFGGTVSIDTSKAGTSGGDTDPNTHTVTLQASSGQSTLSQNNVASNGTTTNNSLAFVNLQGSTSNADAILNIDADTGGTVALYDPIKVVLNNGRTFNMNVNGAGDFLWDGANTITSAAGEINLNAGKTTLLPDFELTASNHDVKINDTATLYLAGAGTLNVSSFTVGNGSGGTLAIASTGQLKLSNTTVYEQKSGATLDIVVDTNRTDAYIVADSAKLDGALNISGISGSVTSLASTLNPTQYLLIQTTGSSADGIDGDFDPARITIGGTPALTVDYARFIAVKSENGNDYTAGIGLTWYSGAADAHGNFTLTDSADTFIVDVPLQNQTGNSFWDGSSLNKYGDGTLTISAANNAYGATTVSAGTLKLTETGKLTNEQVTVKDGGIFDLSGELIAKNITIESGALFKITGTELTVAEKLFNGGTFDMVSHNGRLNLGPDSRLDNNGTIILNNGNNILQSGTLSSTNNSSKIQMYVDIAGQTGDLIEVDGTATGLHSLILKNLGADPTGGEAPLTVAETNGGGATFTGGLTAGAFQYRVQPCAADANDWCLGRSGYSSNIANYVEAQRINAETGFQQLANLHQRVGEHRNLPLELQSWARTYYNQDSEDGKRRFGHDQDTTGIQVGHELLAQGTGNGGTLRAAIAFDAARTDADFKDRTSLQRDTGSVKAESYALGGYLTHTTASGAYLDLVVQTAKLHNDFIIKKTGEPHDKATQKGWRAGFSLEGGYPLWKIDNAWLLEGQAQLSYQYTKYQSFKDATFKVGGYDADTLRGRIGARLVRDLTNAENKSLKLYGLVNAHHDFLKPESVTFVNRNNGGSTPVSERYGKSWGELGVGIQGWANKSTSVFGDVSYQHGFSSPDKGDAREGGSVNVGARFSF